MTEQTGSDVVVEYAFDAPIDRVWSAWTDPGIVGEWWGSDPAGVVTFAALDVRVGGGFEICFRDSTSAEHTCFGTYLRVVPTTALEFTWAWVNEPGVTSRVTVEFETLDAETRIRFVHSELGAASGHDYAAGWRRTFGKLDRVLAVHAEG
ncbi:SRPBCC domain-containing protein [Microbacterium sp. KUDC0406]|uniref:SRPBCC family protein n=1 Tax=Microbacterium sp. KUDC0406 TaxID=2909588 RepID=UPI001F41763C|nr:SRPBCC domain-containing protein [Microbacterium sp. KUDC0406]UJP10155.1 SRPBCC domain-containing protein [Microbacterium sp. KUDC0406]